MDRRKLHPRYVLAHRDRIVPYLRWRYPQLLAPAYVGRRHECGLCHAKLRRFAMFFYSPTHPGLPVQCPFCQSQPRTRQQWWWMQQSGLLQGAPRLLHVAPEESLTRRLHLESQARITSVDLLRDDVDVQASLTDLPFDDGSYDLVLCSHVLEHIPDDLAAMKEMHRVLSPDGVALIAVPLSSSPTVDGDDHMTDAERDAAFGQPDHVRLYGFDIVDRLTSAGFDVEQVRLPDALQLPPASLHHFGLHGDDTLFVCRRA